MESAKYSGKITDSINIIAFAGATGGFVGYNYEGAVITGVSANNRVTTTDKMNVTMLRGQKLSIQRFLLNIQKSLMAFIQQSFLLK